MFKKRKTMNPRYDLGNIDNLNQREYSIIQHGLSEGIAKISLVEKKKKAYLVADVTGLLTLNKFLEGVISTQVFFKIVEGITITILKGKKELLQEPGFDISFDKIFVSPDTKKITLVYWPSLDFKSGTSLDAFFIQLLNKAKLDNQVDDNVRKYIEFFGSSRVFSLKNFAKLIASIQNIDLSGIISDSKELFTLGINDKQSGTGRTDSSRKLASTETNYVPEFRKTENLSITKESGSSSMSEATTVLGLEPEIQVPRLQVSLKRISTDSQVSVVGSEFTIGKQGCDYNIIDNNAISRNHARINVVDNQVVIADLNSSNGTKINGNRISAETGAVLQHGDLLSLANEDFEVSIRVA